MEIMKAPINLDLAFPALQVCTDILLQASSKSWARMTRQQFISSLPRTSNGWSLSDLFSHIKMNGLSASSEDVDVGGAGVAPLSGSPCNIREIHEGLSKVKCTVSSFVDLLCYLFCYFLLIKSFVAKILVVNETTSVKAVSMGVSIEDSANYNLIQNMNTNSSKPINNTKKSQKTESINRQIDIQSKCLIYVIIPESPMCDFLSQD